MKKSLFLYLFIIAVLMNVFTYKYFSSKDGNELQSLTETNKRMKDSLVTVVNQLYDADAFSLANNDRAQNYLAQNNIKAFEEKVKQALLAYNDDKEGNKYTDQTKMGEQKFIINKVKLLNHRWIIANYSNGELWGEVMLKYFVNDDQTISFEVMSSYLYPKELN
ncbi:hypothetical protein [Flavobacterium phycosphaerae]|uniref:hypothetical protein n=1 Tax=Flavobacterium phycosphaerae TaxID=2697515 RepID=UPI00138AED9E|nr:hypothetical protein [Flavobacterium phycosphaerae]